MAQRYIYLSDELNNKLKQEKNASGLIQSLLTEHFRKNDVKQMTYEEKLLKIKELEAKLEFEKKVEAIHNENSNN